MKLLRMLNEREIFSSVEQGIIEYMMDNSREIVNMTIRDLAEATYTSVATIFRLCQKCGLKGYTDFKIKFISEISRTNLDNDNKHSFSIKELNHPLRKKDNLSSIINKISFLQIESIEETKNEINIQMFEKVISIINDCDNIVFLGFDLNYYISQSTVYHLLQINKKAICYQTVNSSLSKVLAMENNEVAILISRTGENKRLIQFAKILKEKGIKTILLSTIKTSSLAKLCDYFLYVANTEQYINMGGVVFSIGCRYILDTIFAAIWVKNIEKSEKFIALFENANGNVCDKDRLW